jgi:hypothetical protein
MTKTWEQPLRPPVTFDFVTEDGWLHSHGMADHGMPELEMRGIPAFLADQAADLLRQACRRMIESGRPGRPGDTLVLSPRVRLRLVEARPEPGDDHAPVRRLEVVDAGTACGCCGMPAGGHP